ncbi:hypothetical protein LTR82_017858 [Friedmanniomyces endolithicus]|uniref:Uncharacterized protein n=1 Tax=Friedmanniomyces endolithicus TaxID=329885 RepID=A0AAN6IZU7_9PEZI|nr:hypothetical protein LTR82_017858 [Friedmanniomyces endolithicus]
MTSPSESIIVALAASATIERDDDVGSITPPPLIGEERDEESRQLEARARQDLESEGCAPCYPPHLEVPARHPPEEYRQIIDIGSPSDWRKFRHYQRLQQEYYGKKPFSLLEAEIRERRQRNGLDDDVHLLPDTQQQNWQQNWIEFQDFHLEFWERKTKDRQRLQDRLEQARKIAGDRGAEGSGRAARDVMGIPQVLEYAESILRWHHVFLQRIERQRVAMDPRPSTPVELSSGDQDTSFLTCPNSPLQILKRRKTKPRHTKEKALTLFSPQRVAKTKRLAVTRATLHAGTQHSDARQSRVLATRQRPPSSELPLPTRRSIMTRKGRTSREPERWVPG